MMWNKREIFKVLKNISKNNWGHSVLNVAKILVWPIKSFREPNSNLFRREYEFTLGNLWILSALIIQQFWEIVARMWVF